MDAYSIELSNLLKKKRHITIPLTNVTTSKSIIEAKVEDRYFDVISNISDKKTRFILADYTSIIIGEGVINISNLKTFYKVKITNLDNVNTVFKDNLDEVGKIEGVKIEIMVCGRAYLDGECAVLYIETE